ncbi:MAG: LemA family protein [Patescibacteria group bacterium]
MKNKTWLIIGTIVLLVVIYFFGTYNNFVNGREAINGQWAQVEAQYQRRLDLIPNLVNSVKGAMKQEQQVFDAIAEARTKYGAAATVDQKAAAAGQIETAFGRLLAIMENYPQLKSIDTVQTLMVQLEGTENRVSVERQRFNDSVRSFNAMTKRFPSNIVAGIFGFSAREYFEAQAGSENAPSVQF